MKKASSSVRKALINAVKFQVKENNPPETKQAYMRLLGEGISEKDVYIYLAQALSYDLFAMMRDTKSHDSKNYANLLAKLPNLD